MRTIGVGLIGTGYMGKCHALAWTGVHAVFDDTPIVRRVMLCEVEEGLARRRCLDHFIDAAGTQAVDRSNLPRRAAPDGGGGRHEAG